MRRVQFPSRERLVEGAFEYPIGLSASVHGDWREKLKRESFSIFPEKKTPRHNRFNIISTLRSLHLRTTTNHTRRIQ